jgi:hypothetical protein
MPGKTPRWVAAWFPTIRRYTQRLFCPTSPGVVYYPSINRQVVLFTFLRMEETCFAS